MPSPAVRRWPWPCLWGPRRAGTLHTAHRVSLGAGAAPGREIPGRPRPGVRQQPSPAAAQRSRSCHCESPSSRPDSAWVASALVFRGAAFHVQVCSAARHRLRERRWVLGDRATGVADRRAREAVVGTADSRDTCPLPFCSLLHFSYC